MHIIEKNGYCEYLPFKAQNGKKHYVLTDDGHEFEVDTRWTSDQGYECSIYSYEHDDYALRPWIPNEYEAWNLHDLVVQDPAKFYSCWMEKEGD